MSSYSIEKLYQLYVKHPHICTDTRRIVPDSIFVALKGSNFDANDFALAALEKGSAYAIIDNPIYEKDSRCILVKDTLETLQTLANFHRKQLSIPIIGVTGTNGKTTTKELIRSVLSVKYKVYATEGNLNNHIGVPLTLLSIPQNAEIAIVEMGANHIGEIGDLCKIAEPDYGLITNIGKAHLEGFGSFEGVLKTKTDLYRWIKEVKGLLFVNADNPLLIEHSQGNKRLLYGTRLPADILGRMRAELPFLRFDMEYSQDSVEVSSHLFGSYNLENALAASLIGLHFGLNLQEVKQGIEQYIPANGRSQLLKTLNNELIVDAYNANPSSMEASILSFISLNDQHQIYILGDMLELGKYSQDEHQKIVDRLENSGAVNVYLIGDCFSKTNYPQSFTIFSSVETCKSFLQEHPIKGAKILLKASHGIHLEKLIDVL